MTKPAYKKICNRIQSTLINYWKKTKKIFSNFLKKINLHVNSWWRIATIIICLLTLLYYPIGGWLIHNTATPTYQPNSHNGNMASIDSMIHLIDQEVRQKIWTPNLPIIFPSYFLDDMPNFQLGIVSAIAKSAAAIGKLEIKTINQASGIEPITTAIELLQYPGTIWLVSPNKGLTPAASSGTQYKKGAKALKAFNQRLSEGKTFISRDADNFSTLLKFMRSDLTKLIKKTHLHIQENQTSLFDFQADNVYYYAYGKLYAYTQIAKGYSLDFKEVLIENEIYSTWTSFLKTIDEVSAIRPTIIRNGSVTSSFSPNHLITINYHTSLAVNYLDVILRKLSSSTKN